MRAEASVSHREAVVAGANLPGFDAGDHAAHVLLAAHVGTIMGVETNAMQFYPEASTPEEAVHPGLYRRRNGVLDLGSLTGSGFGYRVAEINRELPPPAVSVGM